MAQVESLTVQILGDSSSLQQELSTVADMLEQMQQQLEGVSEGASGIGQAFASLSSSLGPLQGLGHELTLISQQIQQLASLPVTLNVQPALDALGQLMRSAQAAAMQLAALSMASIPGLPTGPMGGFPMGGTGGGSPPLRAYAGGGLVSGPGGIDQVSARLTAGEFVLNQEAVTALGFQQLDRWNQGLDLAQTTIPAPGERPLTAVPEQRSPPREIRSVSSPLAGPMQQTMNHFGGIEIHVQQPTDAGAVLHDLRRQGISARHRWG